MKVLLIKDVKDLGRVGEIKEVKDGYGQNFLVGKGFAKVATPDVVRQWESHKRNEEAKKAAEIARLKEVKVEIEKLKLLIKRKTGANGALFGAITKEEIAECLHSHHIDINKKELGFEHVLKATGNYDIDVKLGHGIHANLSLTVEAL